MYEVVGCVVCDLVLDEVVCGVCEFVCECCCCVLVELFLCGGEIWLLLVWIVGW